MPLGTSEPSPALQNALQSPFYADTLVHLLGAPNEVGAARNLRSPQGAAFGMVSPASPGNIVIDAALRGDMLDRTLSHEMAHVADLRKSLSPHMQALKDVVKSQYELLDKGVQKEFGNSAEYFAYAHEVALDALRKGYDARYIERANTAMPGVATLHAAYSRMLPGPAQQHGDTGNMLTALAEILGYRR